MNKKLLAGLIIMVALIASSSYWLWSSYITSVRTECSHKALEEADKQSSPMRLKLSGESKSSIYDREYQYCVRNQGLPE